MTSHYYPDRIFIIISYFHNNSILISIKVSESFHAQGKLMPRACYSFVRQTSYFFANIILFSPIKSKKITHLTRGFQNLSPGETFLSIEKLVLTFRTEHPSRWLVPWSILFWVNLRFARRIHSRQSFLIVPNICSRETSPVLMHCKKITDQDASLNIFSLEQNKYGNICINKS